MAEAVGMRTAANQRWNRKDSDISIQYLERIPSPEDGSGKEGRPEGKKRANAGCSLDAPVLLVCASSLERPSHRSPS